MLQDMLQVAGWSSFFFVIVHECFILSRKTFYFHPQIFRGCNANAESGEVDKEGGQQDR